MPFRFVPERKERGSDRRLSCQELTETVLAGGARLANSAVAGTRSKRMQEGSAGVWLTRNQKLKSPTTAKGRGMEGPPEESVSVR